MPRRSAASLAVLQPRVDVRKTRLEPPPDLTEPERALFLQLVNSNAPEHFRESDRPLLREYIREIMLARSADDEIEKNGAVLADGRINPWLSVRARAVKAMCVLSARLRLNPQARLHNKSVARQVVPRHPPPWQQDGEEAGDA
jgi:hypothetical protein